MLYGHAMATIPQNPPDFWILLVGGGDWNMNG